VAKEKNIPSRILLRLFYSSPAVGDWIETRVEYGTSWYSRSFSIRRKVNCNRILSIWLFSEVKVGVTQTQVPTRWIDQGANKPFYCGSSQSLLSRNYRGGAENHYDKTNWRKMLTNNVEQIDLVAERLKVKT
jgi:hypothetical protein